MTSKGISTPAVIITLVILGAVAGGVWWFTGNRQEKSFTETDCTTADFTITDFTATDIEQTKDRLFAQIGGCEGVVFMDANESCKGGPCLIVGIDENYRKKEELRTRIPREFGRYRVEIEETSAVEAL